MEKALASYSTRMFIAYVVVPHRLVHLFWSFRLQSHPFFNDIWRAFGIVMYCESRKELAHTTVRLQLILFYKITGAFWFRIFCGFLHVPTTQIYCLTGPIISETHIIITYIIRNDPPPKEGRNLGLFTVYVYSSLVWGPGYYGGLLICTIQR
jgi:hypothetical protein